MAEVIVIMNKKGGVGKTTTAISLAAGFNYCGYRVLAVDIDGQGHLSKFAGAECDGRNTILELIDGKASFDATVQHVSFGDIIPADSYLDDYLMRLTANPAAPFLIRKMLKDVQQNYDYIIIDCPPAINQLTIAAIVAATKIIIPTEAEFFAVDGVTMLMSKTISAVREHYNPNLSVEGFLVIKYKSHLKETREMANALQAIAHDYFGTKIFNAKIRATVSLPASQRLQKSIFEYNSKCNASQDYLALIKELIA